MKRGNLDLRDDAALARHVRAATHQQETRLRRIFKLYEQLKDDSKDSFLRLKHQLCVICFYVDSGGIAGAAFTKAPCAHCAKDMMFPSTLTDLLCPDCAKKHKLCKHCGANLQLREGKS